MTDEQYVLQQKPKARVKWKQSEQPTCFIDDGFGQTLGQLPMISRRVLIPISLPRPGRRPNKIWRVLCRKNHRERNCDAAKES